MPNDLWITIPVTIAVGVITHQINQSALVATITQKMGNVMRKLISLAARFGGILLILIMCTHQLIAFGVSAQPLGRWEILGSIYFSILGFEFVKFFLTDLHDLRSGKKPL